jgi:hypothetical protein
MGVGTSAYNLTGFTTLEQFSAVKLLYRPIQYAILTRKTSSEGAEKRARGLHSVIRLPRGESTSSERAFRDDQGRQLAGRAVRYRRDS